MAGKKRLFSSICDMPYGHSTPYKLFDAAKNSKEFVQKLRLQKKIQVHDGCVNSICWNESGKYILSGSDDQKLSVVNGYDYSVTAFIETGHRANIFSAKFLPNCGDNYVVSCSGDGIIIYSDLDRSETSLFNKFNCHLGTAYEIMTIPHDSKSFLSCGEDRTVRWFDVRTKTSCLKEDCKDDVLINCQSPVTSLAVNPMIPYQLAVGCADASVRIFDRRMLGAYSSGFPSTGYRAMMSCFTVPEFKQSRRITSLCYSNDGREMLVSYSSDYIYLFDVQDDFDKRPKLLVKDKVSNDSDDSSLFFGNRPVMKRLRVRGDWSDTGPNARPEAENTSSERPSSSRTIVRTMTDILTRMFHSQSSSSASYSPPSSQARSSEFIEDREQPQPNPQQQPNSQQTELQPAAEGSSTSPNTDTQNKKWEQSESSNCAGKIDMRSQPSTSQSAFDEESSNNKVQALVGENVQTFDHTNLEVAGSSNASETVPTDLHQELTEASVSNDLKLNSENIEGRLESRRKDLFDRHHAEPMVNLHYSGQSVSSGLITMNVASSSEANERQWLEQTATDLPELPSSLQAHDQSEATTQTDNPHRTESSESDTESSLQTIQINDGIIPIINDTHSTSRDSSESETEPSFHIIESERNLLPIISNIRSLASPASARTDGLAGSDDREVELMMEVDTWEVDSDDDEGSREETSSRHNIVNYSDKLMESFRDEAKNNNEELKEDSYLSTVSQPRVKKKYSGHRNARTMIKESTFWGDNFVMSGSDCGHIFIWDRFTTEVVMIMEADHHVVNCLQPHPFDPILASSGIDYDIKLWAPLKDEPYFDVEKANELIKRNEIMLEETKDTITVPASFMFRMLTRFSNFRSNRARRWTRAAQELRRSNRQDYV